MKAAIIGASEEALYTIEKAKEAGIYTVALDGDKEAAGLKAADKAVVVDISDEEAVISCLKEEQIDFVLTVPIGRYLTTIGAVNDAFNLKGLSSLAAINCTDKYLFHSLLAEKGLRPCACHLIRAGENIENEKKMSYPAIAKPRYGSGSRGIHYIQNEEEQNNLIKELSQDKEDYLIESVLAGEEYGVDAIVEGTKVHLVLLRRKLQTPLPARQAVAYISVVPKQEPELYECVNRYLEKAACALQLENCLMHADLMIEGQQVAAIEISARPSGHQLHNLFTPLVTGTDMAKEFIAYLSGNAYCFEPAATRKLMIHYFDLEGKVEKVPSKEDVLQIIKANVEKQGEQLQLITWNCKIAPGDELCPVTTGHSLMGRGYFILEGSREEDLISVSRQILESFTIRKKALAIITARGGSKRLPGKNKKEFCGKPIMCYSIQAALESGVFDEVMVSTDDNDIAQIALGTGARVPFMRSAETAGDYASTDAVIMEVLKEYAKRGTVFEQFCCIYPTAPFVTGKKLKAAMQMLDEADSVMPIVRFSYPPQRGMVVEDGKLVRSYPEHINTRSQDLEPMYHDCGQFYACRYEPFMKEGTTDLENLVPILMSEMEVQDIDTAEDWAIAELKYEQMLRANNIE